MSRTFHKGTQLKVGDVTVTFEGDVPVSFFRDESPDAFAGLLAVSGFDGNFELNIHQLEPRTYNIHGVYQGDMETTEAPAVEEAEDESPKQGKLPEDFPGRAALEDADINTFAQARKQRDGEGLTAVPGIGAATAAKIEEAL